MSFVSDTQQAESLSDNEENCSRNCRDPGSEHRGESGVHGRMVAAGADPTGAGLSNGASATGHDSGRPLPHARGKAATARTEATNGAGTDTRQPPSEERSRERENPWSEDQGFS